MIQYALSYLDGEVYGFADSDRMPVLADGCIAHVMADRVPHFPKLTPTAKLYIANNELYVVETATLVDAQAHAWEAAKAAREAAEAADFEFEGVMYQPDVKRITGGVLKALMAQLTGVPFSTKWTVADNSEVPLDGAQMQALGLALASRIDAIHETGRAIRKLIADAQTPEAAYAAAAWPATPTEEPNA